MWQKVAKFKGGEYFRKALYISWFVCSHTRTHRRKHTHVRVCVSEQTNQWINVGHEHVSVCVKPTLLPICLYIYWSSSAVQPLPVVHVSSPQDLPPPPEPPPENGAVRCPARAVDCGQASLDREGERSTSYRKGSGQRRRDGEWCRYWSVVCKLTHMHSLIFTTHTQAQPEPLQLPISTDSQTVTLSPRKY